MKYFMIAYFGYLFLSISWGLWSVYRANEEAKKCAEFWKQFPTPKLSREAQQHANFYAGKREFFR